MRHHLMVLDLSTYLNELTELSNNNIKVFYSETRQRFIFYRYLVDNSNSFSLIYQSNNNNCITKQPITKTLRNPSKNKWPGHTLSYAKARRRMLCHMGASE